MTSVEAPCPSAGLPMASGDGLISRLRLPTGCITNRQLESLADRAEQFGHGVLELTNRGNLQVRGLNESSDKTSLNG